MCVCASACAYTLHKEHQNIRKDNTDCSQRRRGAANAHNTTQLSAKHKRPLAKVLACVYKQQQIVSNPESAELACEIQPVRSLHSFNVKAQAGKAWCYSRKHSWGSAHMQVRNKISTQSKELRRLTRKTTVYKHGVPRFFKKARKGIFRNSGVILRFPCAPWCEKSRTALEQQDL